MFLEELVSSCDFTDRVYNPPVKGAWAIARGASGRWCCVMYAGPEWLAESNALVLNRTAFEAAWQASPSREPHDWLEV